MCLIEYIKKIDANSLNGSDLAYIGDAYYELYVRSYLLSLGYTKPEELHKLCINYVSAKSHAKIYEAIGESLTEKEKKVILLYYYEELTLKEISAVLDVSESRVSQLHTKAIQKLRLKLGANIELFFYHNLD